MTILNRAEAAARINFYNEKGVPCFFLTDFLGENAVVEPLDGLAEKGLLFDFGKWKNCRAGKPAPKPFFLEKQPEPFEKYQDRFDIVLKNILFGNSFLVTLLIRKVKCSFFK